MFRHISDNHLSYQQILIMLIYVITEVGLKSFCLKYLQYFTNFCLIYSISYNRKVGRDTHIIHYTKITINF